MSHPSSCTDPGCRLSYRDHLLGITVSSTAMPTRKASTARTEQRERTLSRDLDAYKRLRQDGLQPNGIDGCAVLEQKADSPVDVEFARYDHWRGMQMNEHVRGKDALVGEMREALG